MSNERILDASFATKGNKFIQDKIVAKNVGLVYNVKRSETKKEAFVAVEDLSINVRTGEFLSIVGPSGCGKSTFLDIVAGLINGTSGEIYIDGKLIKGPALDRGIVMQGYALFPWRTIQKNIEFGLEIKKVKKKEREEISKYFLELVGLKGFENRYPYELSGGMKQRVAIARALAYDPEVLLMDEPFAALDAQTREVLQFELLKIWEKTHKTIIFITHSIEEAVYLSDRVAVMTKNPGTIREVIDIDLPRPRDNGEIRTSADFSLLRHKIWGLLHEKEAENKKASLKEQDIAEQISPSAAL
jgi:NitT/TauT family transport system ATP-binding protein